MRPPAPFVAMSRPGLITHRVAARDCRVSPEVVLLWVETGAWPLPRAVLGVSLYFDPDEVRLWLLTGAWPTGSRFRSTRAGRAGPELRAPPAAPPHSRTWIH